MVRGYLWNSMKELSYEEKDAINANRGKMECGFCERRHFLAMCPKYKIWRKQKTDIRLREENSESGGNAGLDKDGYGDSIGGGGVSKEPELGATFGPQTGAQIGTRD